MMEILLPVVLIVALVLTPPVLLYIFAKPVSAWYLRHFGKNQPLNKA